MIEINLVPDVKQELLKAQRIRNGVISLAIIASIVVLGVTAVLALYVFGIQTGRGYLSDQAITTEDKKLSAVPDISNVLTLQNQLAQLSSMHDGKNITSRLFDVINTITPQDENRVTISNLVLDSDAKTVKIDAQAANGYQALDVFKKTVAATKLRYTKDGQTQEVALGTDLIDGDRSYGQDVNGQRVLRFTLSFTYPDELFAYTSGHAQIIAPTKTNVTDSLGGVPTTLFERRASDEPTEGQ